MITKYKIIWEEEEIVELPYDTPPVRTAKVYPIEHLETGERGGWVASARNLDQAGDCWISGNVYVAEKARITGDAQIHSDVPLGANAANLGKGVQIFGNTVIGWSAEVSCRVICYEYPRVLDQVELTGDCVVRGYSRLYGNIKIGGQTVIAGRARLSGHVHVNGDILIDDDVRLYGRARIMGNVNLKNYVRIFGEAVINGNGSSDLSIEDNARISGCVLVEQDAYVGGNAVLYGPIHLFSPDHKVTGASLVTNCPDADENDEENKCPDKPAVVDPDCPPKSG